MPEIQRGLPQPGPIAPVVPHVPTLQPAPAAPPSGSATPPVTPDVLPYSRPDAASLSTAQGHAMPAVSLDPTPPAWNAATKAQIRRSFTQGLQSSGITAQEVSQLLKRFGISSLEINEDTIQNPAYSDEINRIQSELGKRLNHPALRELGQGNAVKADGQFGKASVQAVAALRDALRGEPIELKVTPIEQKTGTGCYRTAEAMLYNVIHGKDGSEDAYGEADIRERVREQDRAGAQTYVAKSENESGRVTVLRDQSMLMLDTIDEELEAGRPVIAGVSYRAQHGIEYNEGITDHFVLISGRGYDEAGTFYTFQDPANGKTHQLRLDPMSGRLSGKGDMVGTYDVTLINKATVTDAATTERYHKLGRRLFTQGQSNAQIQDMQVMLTAMGYGTKGTTGAYGNGTAAAVKAFQQAHGLPETGSSVDTHTLKQIKASFREHLAAKPDQLAFKRGQSSPQIGALQTALTKAGYSTKGTTGVFGNGTEAAVRAFQNAQNIPVNGVIDHRTWLKILEAAG